MKKDRKKKVGFKPNKSNLNQINQIIMMTDSPHYYPSPHRGPYTVKQTKTVIYIFCLIKQIYYISIHKTYISN